MCLFVLTVQFCSIGAGAYKQGKISVQELGSQRREGAYFWKNMVYAYYICMLDLHQAREHGLLFHIIIIHVGGTERAYYRCVHVLLTPGPWMRPHTFSSMSFLSLSVVFS